jgi:PAS domain S-box-containing protein
LNRLGPRDAYLLAAGLVLLALGVRVALDPYFNGFPGLLIFVLPILAAAHFGGARSGLAATCLAGVASEILPSLRLTPLVFDLASYRAVQVFLLAMGITFSLLYAALHRARALGRELAGARARAEEALTSQVALSASAQEIAGLGSWDFDLGTGVLRWSDETHRIFGVAVGAFGGSYEAFLAYVHPDDVPRITTVLPDQEPRASVEVEYRIVRPDGTERLILDRGQFVRDVSGRATRRTGVVMDITERAAALAAQGRLGEETRRREQILSVMLASITDFAYIFDREGRFLFANKPLLDLWQLQLGDVVGKGFGDLGYPAQLTARLNAQLDEVMRTARVVTGETEYVSASGKGGTYEYIFSPVVAADGTVEFVVGSTREMTGRKAHERELARAEAQYRSLFENSADGIFQNTPEGRMTAANPALARMLGYGSPAELIAARVDVAQQSYVNPEMRAEFQARLERDGMISGFEYQVRCKDGTAIWVSENVRVVRDAGGRPQRYEGNVQDITVRRLAEEALRLSNITLHRQTAELRVLFDLMPAMIWFKDTTGRILRANQRAAHAAGLAIAEIEGRPTAEIYPRDAARYQADDKAVIDSGLPRMGLVERLVNATGTDLWIETDKVPYFDQQGNVVGIVVMAQDITERRSEERKASHQLVEASRLGGKAEVATEVLHDIGNILNSVNVSAALVVENVRNSRASRMADVVALLRENRADLATYITTDPQGQHVPEMLEALSREWVAQQKLLVTELGQLHENVDRIKRAIDAQQTHAVAADIIESMGVDELVEDAVRLQQGVLAEQQVHLVRDFTSMPPILVARHKAVGILVSLLINGRQACKLRDPASRRITLRIERRPGHAAIRVTDNGAGIPAENLVRIFAPGFTTQADARGYGLHGAALAAAELGGSLDASSEGVGRGATFTLELPLRHAA